MKTLDTHKNMSASNFQLREGGVWNVETFRLFNLDRCREAIDMNRRLPN